MQHSLRNFKKQTMKFIVSFLCFYFLILILLPSVRAVKMQFVQNCKSSYELDISKNKVSDEGCEKEKCLMNLNFSSSNFLLFNQNFKIEIVYSPLQSLEKSQYHKKFISNYNASIWEPPEYKV